MDTATLPQETKANGDGKPRVRGLTITPHFAPDDDRDAFDVFGWRMATAQIKDEKGNVIFEQPHVEVPVFWSDRAANVVASKYFYGDKDVQGPPEKGGRENSVRQLVGRVANAIAQWGLEDGYFAEPQDSVNFARELIVLCAGQYGAFNSPVWFNVGLSHQYGIRGAANNWRWDPKHTRVAESELIWIREYNRNYGYLPDGYSVGDYLTPPTLYKGAIVRCEDAYAHPQASACFIQSVSDDMTSIMALATSEAMLFKYGSGTGTDLSTLRSTKEKLAGGGKPSGPVSFMRIYDATASVIKSGGKTRRAAKMQTLKDWHPDVMEFIQCKPLEDAKARALIAAGYSSDLNGDAYSTVAFQNANLSVRLSDAMLTAFEQERANDANGTEVLIRHQLRAVTTGEAIDHVSPSTIINAIAEGTWQCGDPGVQYEDTIQRWHTCPNTAPINSSNPCSEYMFIDDSACNLASINLMRFRRNDGTFDDEGFRYACEIFIIAQEILVDRASYPTEKIALNSHRFRPLGLGYANLGSLLMSLGLPYDSERGRDLAAAITSIMHASAYLMSAEIASHVGAFEGFHGNRPPMLRVIEQHRSASRELLEKHRASSVTSEAERLAIVAAGIWDAVQKNGERYGYRNSQVTVLAPTGTIAFMMDCDTTGIEPAIALVAYKTLAGGGMIKLVNGTVKQALKRLGYSDVEIGNIIAEIEANDSIEGASHLLDPGHLAVFDCAFPPAGGGRSISYMGHIRMMAAVQPFLSGAISKTVNMPADATAADIRDAYLAGWKLGLKALAIYRDGSKESQPVKTSQDRDSSAPVDLVDAPKPVVTEPHRERLPDTRRSLTHKFEVDGHEGYVTVGLYPDGRPGELFIQMAKEGSTIGGLMDALATSVSIGLQCGVPLDVFVQKFAFARFEPSGFTKNRDIPIARSLTDYVFRWLGLEFIPGYRDGQVAIHDAPQRSKPAPAKTDDKTFSPRSGTDRHCKVCGSITIQTGSCYSCPECGEPGSCG